MATRHQRRLLGHAHSPGPWGTVGTHHWAAERASIAETRRSPTAVGFVAKGVNKIKPDWLFRRRAPSASRESRTCMACGSLRELGFLSTEISHSPDYGCVRHVPVGQRELRDVELADGDRLGLPWPRRVHESADDSCAATSATRQVRLLCPLFRRGG